MAAPKGVRLVAADEKDRAVPEGPGEEPEQGPSGCVQGVEILEDHHDRPVSGQAAEHGPHGFLRPLGQAFAARRARRRAREAGGDRRQEGAQLVSARAEEAEDLAGLAGAKEPLQRDPDRPVGGAAPGRQPVTPQDRRGRPGGAVDAQPQERLVDQATRAEAGGAGQQERAGPAGRGPMDGLEKDADLLLATDEPLGPADARRHARHSRGRPSRILRRWPASSIPRTS